MENLRSGELYVFSDNEFFNPPSYAVVSGWACDGISLSVLMTESPLPEPSMRIDWDCRLPHGLSYSRLPTDAERDRFFRMLKVCDSQQKLVEHCFADHGDRCEIRFKVGSINSIFYFLHKAAEPFNCLEQDNLA